MLVVDSPFPPYSPVKYEFKGLPPAENSDTCWSTEAEKGLGNNVVPVLIKDTWNREIYVWEVDGVVSRSDGRPASMERKISGITGAGDVSKDLWQQNGLIHRDGDLPAVVWDGINFSNLQYWQKGFSHRFNDVARIIVGGENVTKEFFLYGLDFTSKSFFSIHETAIKHNIPLWVAFCMVEFGGLDLGDSFFTEADANHLFSELPIEWTAKTLGITAYMWDELNIRSGYDKDTATSLISLIQYERDSHVSC